MTSHSAASRRSAGNPLLLIAGILVIATALRAPVTGVPPLIGMIREQLALNSTAAGMLITLPLLAFAVVSLFAAGLARRYGLERTLFGALLLIAGGIAARTLGSAWSLYLGTAVIGSGIAIGNVLLPSLLKRDFPQRVAGLTSAYVLTMSLAAGLASAIAIPLANLSDATWRFSTGCLLLVPLAGALLWLPQLANHTAPAATTAHAPHGGRLWHSALAWQVTLYLGINSFVFYVGVSWLPAILRDAGYSAERAGSLHGLLQLMSAGPALFLAPVVRRMKDQRGAAFCSAASSFVAFVGLITAPGWATAWIVLLGLGTGGGPRGDLTRLTEQAKRLFTSHITLIGAPDSQFHWRNVNLTDSGMLLWNPHDPDAKSPWESQLTLSQKFFDECIAHSVPIDLRVLHKLRSPLAIDIYIWMTYRYNSISAPTPISWKQLKWQFGANYADDEQGLKNFITSFKTCLRMVSSVYREAKFRTTKDTLT
ncbi:MAG: MFS transporter, partial [Achromobacter sp.]|nr:MFS transporter [Achromobacter sp.]